MTADWRWPNFSSAEMSCRCGCGSCEMDPGFMDALQALRTEYGRPMVVTSGYRCEAHNAALGASPRHATGRAADIAMHGAGMRRLLRCTALDRFSSIGLRMHGRHEGRFVHLDMCEPEAGVIADIVWTYEEE